MLQVGSVTLKSPVFLAPMSGVSDFPFRSMVTSFGEGNVVSEMIASESMIRQTRQSLLMAKPLTSSNATNITQIAGVKPNVMAEAAKLAVDMGAAIVDINMGCPAKKVVGQAAGSALMKDLRHARQILSQVVKAVSVPVTLKMRKGWDDETQNAPELAYIAQEEGVQMITVHGRTRCQFYRGDSDWAFFERVRQKISIPFVGNGDIKTPQTALSLMKQYNLNGIMIGRACYGRPWRIAQVHHFLRTQKLLPEPSVAQQKEIVLTHLGQLLDFYGKEVGVRIARKHLGWYSKGYASGATFRAQVNQTEKESDLLRSTALFYDTQAAFPENETACTG